MTCKDCIHFTDEQNTQYTDLERFHKCNASKTPFWVEGDCEICEDFENNDGTYSNGTWHCPRCGVPVSKWGLCMDCEILYVAPKRKTVPVNLKVENIYKHESDFSDIDDGIEEIEDSWESVSK